MPSFEDNNLSQNINNNFLVNTESDFSENTNTELNNQIKGDFCLNENKSNSINSKKKIEDDMPLSFASFYYSLKVLKGKGKKINLDWFTDFIQMIKLKKNINPKMSL